MIHTIENDMLRIQINSHGAELWSIFDKKSGVEHLWQGDKAYWPRRAPVLFPHCGRLKDSQYTLNGQNFKSELHGFARDYNHNVLERNDTTITFLFSDNNETIEKYPFQFRLYTIFKLENGKLIQTFKVENVSNEDIYFSIGYHTGYMLPFDSEHTIEDYSLVFDTNETPYEVLCNNAGLLSGEERLYFENKNSIPLHNKLFSNDSFILKGLKSEHVSIVEKDTGKAIRVGIKGFPYTVFWSTPDDVKFVCIEPWQGLPDMHDTDGDFKKKPGIIRLPSSQTFTCQQTIELRVLVPVE